MLGPSSPVPPRRRNCLGGSPRPMRRKFIGLRQIRDNHLVVDRREEMARTGEFVRYDVSAARYAGVGAGYGFEAGRKDDHRYMG